MTAAAPLARTFHALADPSRLHIVERLSRGPASVKQLAEPLDLALPSVMKHLKVLEQGRLVLSEKSGRTRTYRMKPRALASVERWVEQRRNAWNRSFDRLEALVAPAGEDE